MHSKIVVSSLFLVACLVANVRSDMDFCDKLDPEHCQKSPGLKKNCPTKCGGGDGGGGGSETSAPAAPPAEEEKHTTKKATTKAPTTKKVEQKKSCDKRSPCVSLEEANSRFLQRCQATGGALDPRCYPHCRYDEDTPTMKKAFLGGGCPLAQLRTYLTCASNGKDNTACCSDTGVLSQKRTDVCGCFCNPTGPVWPQKGEAGKYGPCVGVLSGIMNCHFWAEGAD